MSINKKILALTGALIVGAMGIVFSENFISKKPDPRLGKPLVDMGDVIGVDTIIVTKGAESLKLVTDGNNVWKLSDTDGFPADATNISRLIDDLTRTNVQVLASTSKEPSSEFGLSDATVIVLQKAGKESLNLKLAKNREHGGQFIAFDNDHKVYLISQSIPVEIAAASWELKNLVNIPSNLVKKVAFASAGKKKAILSREKPEDPVKLEKLAPQEKESSSIRSHESILTGLTFSERLASDNTDYKKAIAAPSTVPSTVTVTLFDGRNYNVKIVSTSGDKKKYFIEINAQNGASTSETDSKELETLNNRMKQNVFEVSSQMAERFQKGLDDMVEKKGS